MKKLINIILAILLIGLFACTEKQSTDIELKSSSAKKAALLVIDMQNDFIPPNGSLQVEGGDSIIGLVNELMALDWAVVIASQDAHPANHRSFASNNDAPVFSVQDYMCNGNQYYNQVMWPDHCIPGTWGQLEHELIDASLIDHYVLKGQDSCIDSYSAFFDNNYVHATTMDSLLKVYDIKDIYICGLATDYCPNWTAIDGKELGYKTYFIYDATRAVYRDSVAVVLERLKDIGVKVRHSDKIL
jgi:nicotinamidase/pyrazinamidase